MNCPWRVKTQVSAATDLITTRGLAVPSVRCWMNDEGASRRCIMGLKRAKGPRGALLVQTGVMWPCDTSASCVRARVPRSTAPQVHLTCRPSSPQPLAQEWALCPLQLLRCRLWAEEGWGASNPGCPAVRCSLPASSAEGASAPPTTASGWLISMRLEREQHLHRGICASICNWSCAAMNGRAGLRGAGP